MKLRPRVHVEALPRSMPAVLSYVRRALSQPNVQEVEITATGISVTRKMEDELAPVVPTGSDDVDINFLLNHVEIVPYRFDPKEHAVYSLYGAMKLLQERKRSVFGIVAPGWPLFSAWLGVEAKEPSETNFGHKTYYVSPLVTNERVVVLGAPLNSIFLTDVDCGVALDLGV